MENEEHILMGTGLEKIVREELFSKILHIETRLDTVPRYSKDSSALKRERKNEKKIAKGQDTREQDHKNLQERALRGKHPQ